MQAVFGILVRNDMEHKWLEIYGSIQGLDAATFHLQPLIQWRIRLSARTWPSQG